MDSIALTYAKAPIRTDKIVDRYRINTNQVFQEQRPFLISPSSVTADHGLIYCLIKRPRTDGDGCER